MSYPEHSQKTKDIIARRFNEGSGAFVVTPKERDRYARIDAIVDARRAEEHEKVKDLCEAQQVIYYASEEYKKLQAKLADEETNKAEKIANIDAEWYARRIAYLAANPQ